MQQLNVFINEQDFLKSVVKCEMALFRSQYFTTNLFEGKHLIVAPRRCHFYSGIPPGFNKLNEVQIYEVHEEV